MGETRGTAGTSGTKIWNRGSSILTQAMGPPVSRNSSDAAGQKGFISMLPGLNEIGGHSRLTERPAGFQSMQPLH
jgi:hypothetical protein